LIIKTTVIDTEILQL